MKDIFGNTVEEKLNNSLRERYKEIPVSIFDTTRIEWINKKRKWYQLGIKSELGRDNDLLGFSKTLNDFQGGDKNKKSISIFDPIVCELMYSWYCKDGGNILDPFSGGG